MGMKWVAQCDNCRKTEDCPTFNGWTGRVEHSLPVGWTIESGVARIEKYDVVATQNVYCSDECLLEVLQGSMQGKAEAMAEQQGEPVTESPE